MWTEDYQNLSTYEKGEFRRLSNYLLSHTYLVRYQYDGAHQMTVANPDYITTNRLFPVLEGYFQLSGWALRKDDTHGFFSLISEFDHNRLRIDRFTTLFLYTCRLIYEDGRQQADYFHVVKTDTQSVIEKMRILSLLDKGKSTQKERLDAQRLLSHYNVIQKMEGRAWHAEGNQILILPAILSMVSNEGIHAMMGELEDLRTTASEEASS